MKLRPWVKKLVGVVTILPLAFCIVAAGVVLLTLSSSYGSPLKRGDFFGPELELATSVLIGVTVAVLLLNYSVMFFLIAHAIMNKELTTGWKVAWALLLLGLNIIIYPVYWYRQVWHENQVPPLGPNMRLVFGGLSLFPLLWLAVIVAASATSAAPHRSPSEHVMLAWALVFDLVFFPLWIYTVVQIIRRPDRATGFKVAWIGVVLGTCVLGLPAYWWWGARRSAQ